MWVSKACRVCVSKAWKVCVSKVCREYVGVEGL